MSRSRMLAAGLGVYCLSWLALSVALRLAGRIAEEHATGWPATTALVLALPVAVVLVWHLPRHPLTVILTVYVGSQFTTMGLGNLLVALTRSGRLNEEVVARLGNALWVGSLPLLPLLMTVFPDGVPGGRWRRLFHAQVAAVVVLLVTALLDNPEDGAHPIIVVLVAACGAVLIGTGTLSAVRLAVRAVRDRDVRRQVAPFTLAAGWIVSVYLVVQPLGLLFPKLTDAAAAALVYPALVGVLPAAIGYAVVRHRLFGINIILTRLLVATTATFVLAVAYLVGVLGIAAILGAPRASVPAMLVPATLVAFVLVPAYRRLQGLVTRAVYGSRGDPLTVLHTLGEHLAKTEPDDVADRIVCVVRDSLKLSWVALEVEQDSTFFRAAEAGVAVDGAEVERFDLSYAGEVPGRLLVQPRRGERTLGRLDRRLLGQVADQAGAAVAAAQLVGELTLSRERLVSGREEERSRLRRDLHDGLSPALAGISLALTAARRLLHSDPHAADALLSTAESSASTSWGDVRKILDGLRPPGLDELGLVGALEERGRSLTRPGEFAVTVAADGLPPLSAAVETAAYRIAVEAMSNSARHAHARHCTVALSVDGRLHVTVEDDGTGLPAQPSPGVGIQSMRARAADIGGQLRLGPADGGGTRVDADLPATAAL
jgi:two-component system NarL family sensor kinase